MSDLDETRQSPYPKFCPTCGDGLMKVDLSLPVAQQIGQVINLADWEHTDELKLAKHVGEGLPGYTLTAVMHRLSPYCFGLSLARGFDMRLALECDGESEALPPDLSRRTYVLAKVFVEALRLYHGDQACAAEFLYRKHPMLDGRTPAELATGSPAEVDAVMALLARADAGVAV